MATFTDRELDVMSVLWDLGSATVAEVRDRLPDKLAYTTVLTVLRTLKDKGHVRSEESGKAHRFVPRVNRHSAGTSALRRLVSKVFQGSPEMLITQLVADRSLTPAQLQRIRRLLAQRGRE